MADHADASPSSSSIWINCPASVTKARGRRRLPTIYTAEGTAAHEVADILIHGLIPPDEITVDGMTFEVDDDMVDAVERYVGYVEKLKKNSDVFATEVSVTIPVIGGEKLYGTADVIAYNETTKNLEIVDLKYGKGVEVSAVGNPQLRIYALGAIQHLSAAGWDEIDTVQMTIIQPRTGGSPGQNTEMIDFYELQAWRDTILNPAILVIDANSQTEVTGSHCRWCVRAGECQSLAVNAQKSAAMVFDDKTGTPDLVHLRGLDDVELAAILDQADMIVGWVERVRAEASHRIDNGKKIPGWKLVAKRAMEKWVDADEAFDQMRKWANSDDLFDQMVKLRTPAQVKKIAGMAKGVTKNAVEKVVGKLTTKESSGTTLARESDAREAVRTDPKSVFEQLTASLEQEA